MKLLTAEIRRDFERTGSQDGRGDDARIIAHFFNPNGVGDWYATEYDPEHGGVFFGFVFLGDPYGAELGYFTRAELESLRTRVRIEIGGSTYTGGKLPVERDRYWDKSKTVGDVRKYHGAPPG